MATKEWYKTDNKMMAFSSIDFVSMSFNHTVQIQDMVLIIFFVTVTGMQTLETQAFEAIGNRLFLTFYFVSV